LPDTTDWTDLTGPLRSSTSSHPGLLPRHPLAGRVTKEQEEEGKLEL
jgi:hypothetical protein